MDAEKKKELIRNYKQAPTFYGVIQLKNNTNGKIFIETVPNTKNRWTYYQLNLNNNFYVGTPLQNDWNAQSGENFSYEVLWEKKTDDVTDMKRTLKKLKKEWFEKLQPFDDRGYNQPLKD